MPRAVPSTNTQKRIAVFGLGKLGACIAATLASRGFPVIGYDVDLRKTEAIRKGLAPIQEPRLQKTIEAAGTLLRATDSVEEAVAQSDVSYFVPSTPSLPDGSFSNQYLLPAVEEAAKAASRLKKDDHLFVVNSTVTPGTLDSVLTPMLETVLGGRCGEAFGLCYNPEFIALGNVIHGLLQPDFVLVGESDPASGALLAQIYQSYCLNSPSVERMANINAELAKISLNCAVTTKISFVNQLSGVCAKIPGADPGVILSAIGKDRRIGSEYLRPGLGFGGPCFPRDNRLFQYIAKSVGADSSLAHATDKINEDVNERLLGTVLAHCPEGESVGVLGLAYKPETAVTDCSSGVWLCEKLMEHNRKVMAHDYLAAVQATPSLHDRVEVNNDPDELVRCCRVLVLTCPWPQYKQVLNQAMPELVARGTIIIDPWRLLESVSGMENLRYIVNLQSTSPSVALGVAANA